jgi:DNA-binding transcriptional regulator YiaG
VLGLILNNMSYGYSSRLIKLNKQADKKHIGVMLGRKCIEADVSVSDIASRLGVSRMTVYNWFAGLHTPRADAEAAIAYLIKTLK